MPGLLLVRLRGSPGLALPSLQMTQRSVLAVVADAALDAREEVRRDAPCVRSGVACQMGVGGGGRLGCPRGGMWCAMELLHVSPVPSSPRPTPRPACPPPPCHQEKQTRMAAQEARAERRTRRRQQRTLAVERAAVEGQGKARQAASSCEDTGDSDVGASTGDVQSPSGEPVNQSGG